jgi:hypothetical protein
MTLDWQSTEKGAPMLVYGVSLVSEILNRPDLGIDVAIVVICGIIHTLAWKDIDLSTASGDAKEAGTAIRGAAAAGITVVGILVPLSILAIQLRSNPQARPLANDVLVSLFVADVWLLLSLACGVYVLWIAAMRAYESRNVLGDKSVGVVIGFQLVFLFVGIFRQVWGMGGLVSDLLR